MNESKISVRYAKALFNLAIENNELETVKNDIVFLNETASTPDFDTFLNSPIIPISKKIIVFKGVFTGKIHKNTLELLILMAKNRREAFLKIITLNFLKLYRNYLNISKAEITTAVPISNENISEITTLLKQLLTGEIEIKNNINPDIIGGFILNIDDRQIDASVKTQLNNYKKELTKSVR